jgi:hypothetical protein
MPRILKFRARSGSDVTTTYCRPARSRHGSWESGAGERAGRARGPPGSGAQLVVDHPLDPHPEKEALPRPARRQPLLFQSQLAGILPIALRDGMPEEPVSRVLLDQEVPRPHPREVVDRERIPERVSEVEGSCRLARFTVLACRGAQVPRAATALERRPVPRRDAVSHSRTIEHVRRCGIPGSLDERRQCRAVAARSGSGRSLTRPRCCRTAVMTNHAAAPEQRSRGQRKGAMHA